MIPGEQGRFCNSCSKTVVDFSVMDDAQVQQYFIANYGKQLCGRFKNTQLQRITISLPQNILRIRLPFWKKFLVAFLIIYGASFFSIDTTIAGVSYTQGDTILTHTTAITNTITEKKVPRILKNKKKIRARRIRLECINMGAFSPAPTIEIVTMGMMLSSEPKFPWVSDLYPITIKNDSVGGAVPLSVRRGRRCRHPAPRGQPQSEQRGNSTGSALRARQDTRGRARDCAEARLGVARGSGALSWGRHAAAIARASPDAARYDP